MISVITPSRCGTKLVSNEFFGFSFNLNRDLQISKAPLKSQAQGTSFFTSAEHSQGPVLSLISTYGSHTSILTSIICIRSLTSMANNYPRLQFPLLILCCNK